MKEKLVSAVHTLNEAGALRAAKSLINGGSSPAEVVSCVHEGVNRAGQDYENKNYFIADLIMAGEIFKEIISLPEMRTTFNNEGKENKATILIGTVKHDHHNLGKDIFIKLAEASGFNVFDLGIDVSAGTFLEVCQDIKPDIIGLSGVVPESINSMKVVIEKFNNKGLRNDLKFILGGPIVNSDICEKVGADAYSNDAWEGLTICKNWMF
ncbi:MAG: cobalamin-binding protein [Eubacteriaceae bacterium]|nr:cobalamin-binding protein [Eubacteriaceae bacterium]